MSVSQGATGAAAPVTIRLLCPTANLGLTELRVTPGVIDAAALELYLYGQCQVLALALHEQTGWPLWVAEQQHPSGTWTWAHVGVQAPDGRWLDILGQRAGHEVISWLEQWGPPARLRLLGDLAEWHVMLGRPASTPASWWRTRITDEAGIALNESFVRLLLASWPEPRQPAGPPPPVVAVPCGPSDPGSPL